MAHRPAIIAAKQTRPPGAEALGHDIPTKIRSAALQAAAMVALVKVITHLLSKGRFSLAHHHLFDRVLTLLGRRLLNPEGTHHLAVAIIPHDLAPQLSQEGACAGRTGTRTPRLPGSIGLAARFDKDETAVEGCSKWALRLWRSGA